MFHYDDKDNILPNSDWIIFDSKTQSVYDRGQAISVPHKTAITSSIEYAETNPPSVKLSGSTKLSNSANNSSMTFVGVFIKGSNPRGSIFGGSYGWHVDLGTMEPTTAFLGVMGKWWGAYSSLNIGAMGGEPISFAICLRWVSGSTYSATICCKGNSSTANFSGDLNTTLTDLYVSLGVSFFAVSQNEYSLQQLYNLSENPRQLLRTVKPKNIPVSATPARNIASTPDASIAFGPYPEVQRPSVNNIHNSTSVNYANINSILDYSNPLTTGLVAASINEGTQQDITQYTNTGGFTLRRDGVYIQGGQYFTATTGRVSNVPLTVVTLMCSLSSGTDVTLFSSYLDGSNNIALKLNSSNQPYAVVFGSATSGIATSSISVIPNQFSTVGAVFSSNTERTIWVNGIKTGTNNTNLTTGNSANNRWGASGTSGYFAGIFRLRLLWNRALSDGEMKSICENPWQVFIDKNCISPIILGPRRKLM